jgi:hypothetical protein
MTARREARGIVGMALVLAAVALATSRARAEDPPPRHQALLLLRVLAYDRNLRTRAGASATVLVLYRSGDLGSESRRGALRTAFDEVARDVVVSGLPVTVEELAYRNPAELEGRLEALHPAMVYVDRALEGSVLEITRVTRGRGVLSADGSRAMVEAGVALAIVARSGRAAVLVNLPAARQEGADLDSALLAVADVLRGEGDSTAGRGRDGER